MIVPLTPLEFQSRAVRLFGGKVGVVDGDRRFTYAEFDERAKRLANAIRAAGVAPGEVVCFLCLNSHHVLEGYYGVVQAGAVFNPLNPRLEADSVRQLLNRVSCPLLIFHASLLSLVEALRPALKVQHYVVVEPEQPVAWAVEYETFLAQASPAPAADLDSIDENDVAEMFYTFGPDGSLHGVMLTHRALYLHTMGFVLAQQLSDADTVLNLAPLYDGNGWGLPQGMVAVGGCQVLLREVDVDTLLRVIAQERVTRFYTVPGFLHALLQHAELESYDISSLTHIVISGAAYTRQLVEDVETRLGCVVEGAYGHVEASPLFAFARAKASLTASAEARLAAQATAGIPIMGVRLRVVDEADEEVPWDGVTAGEVVVRANSIMQGYYGRPDLTDRKIVGGWYRTGDLAVIDGEGYVTLVGEKSSR